MRIDRAMILAAGRGERMQPLTADRAKPALPALGRPVVARIAAHLAGQGIERCAVNAFHQPDSIRAALSGVLAADRCTVFPETLLMGTGGALIAPQEMLGAVEAFLLHNGDTLLDVPVDALAAAAAGERRAGAVLVRPGASPRYNAVLIKDGRFVEISSDPRDERRGRYELGTYLGVAVIRRAVLDRVPTGRPSDVLRDVIIPLLADGWDLAIVPYTGPWLEFTSPKGYRDALLAQTLAGRSTGAVRLPGGDAPIEATFTGALFRGADASCPTGGITEGPVVLEAGARIARGACVRRSVVLEAAEIGWGAVLDGVVVERGVRVPPDARFADGVVVADAERGARCEPFAEDAW